MNTKWIINSNNGFSILQVLILASIIGTVSIVLVRVAQDRFDTQRRTLQDIAIDQTLQALSTKLASEENCITYLKNINLNSPSPPELTIGNYTKNSVVDGNITITSITAGKISDNPVGDNERGLFEIKIRFLRKGKVSTSVLKKIKMVGGLSNGEIQNCESAIIGEVEELREKICTKFLDGGLNDNGYCIKGSGGIEGKLVQQVACEILGGVFNTVTEKCSVVNISGAIRGDALSTQKIEIKNTLNAKSVVVGGGVQLGTTSDCQNGTLRVQSSQLEYCNNNSWIKIESVLTRGACYITTNDTCNSDAHFVRGVQHSYGGGWMSGIVAIECCELVPK